MNKQPKNDHYVYITDTLDLHGTPEKVIREMIHDFIENAIGLKISRVQIIHGKGKSKLKFITRAILKDHPHVVKFYDAAPELGGWGRTVAELSPKPVQQKQI